MKELSVTVKENQIVKDLYYNKEPIMKVSIKYPTFESQEFKLFTNFLNHHYFSKFVVNSAVHIQELYKMAQNDYDYAVKNNFPVREYEYYLEYFITYNENCTISLYYDIYTYTAGAHGSTLRKSDTWILEKHQLMNVYDYIKDSNHYKVFLIDEIIKEIEKTANTDNFYYFDNYKELVEETFQKDNFYLIKEGIVIYFQQYDIAPYSTGIPTFLIPFSSDNITPSC